jgi:hypothetical protein
LAAATNGGSLSGALANDPKAKPPRRIDSAPLTPLYPEDERTADFIPWRTTRPQTGETVRWECVDGRWVAIALGHGASIGTVVVTDSSGRCESVDSYEGALDLAKHWRRR